MNNLRNTTAVANQSGAMEADTISKNGLVIKNKIEIPYKLKVFGIGILTVAAGAIFKSCQPEENLTPQQHDTEYGISRTDMSAVNSDNISKIKASADSSAVRYVYIVPQGNWNKRNISSLIEQGLKPAIAISPKVKGKNNFENVYVTEQDSLWLTINGWTVNQY